MKGFAVEAALERNLQKPYTASGDWRSEMDNHREA
jgi:hypothetical protein